ncbi:uncharacterized protein B0I36DRAFT_362064 [Microdochium trichocladiopsis]|uniref:Uncharacterized protein n=1 Tax=Microdochium trichocladiopsis TaxID=1682393 RepID=A0A9P8Y745_9PEZI|nr:uncharacterized protein B0I36DRAFT_362064 [Microdochium trichocladiopsis]KAH7033390.1 hypothetical protein B0I36DRAFT_362064 [Microdochium trichocladiopsis]
MAFLEDPRLRQRWNQISHTTETVTENAAAGIWSFGHTYINPCFDSISDACGGCVATCFGDREERARRAREGRHSRGDAEFSFDFYDDWDQDLYSDEQGGGILRGWRNEDWDRLLAGTGKRHRTSGGEIVDQPRSKQRGMSYGTRGNPSGGGVRNTDTLKDDPTVIPSTSAIGFLGRLPFKIGGTLRYKPSAANLQEHPGAFKHEFEGEREPLLGSAEGPADQDGVELESDEEFLAEHVIMPSRKRSGTTGSGDTSDSYRSRGDLFPSDGEGEEDAVPLDDDLASVLGHIDDRASNKTRSSKGKRVAGKMHRTVSRTTIDSVHTRPSIRSHPSFSSDTRSPMVASIPSLADLQQEEQTLEKEEAQMIEQKRHAAAQLALRRGLSREDLTIESVPEARTEMVKVGEIPAPERAVVETIGRSTSPPPAAAHAAEADRGVGSHRHTDAVPPESAPPKEEDRPGSSEFVPARLPYFR